MNERRRINNRIRAEDRDGRMHRSVAALENYVIQSLTVCRDYEIVRVRVCARWLKINAGVAVEQCRTNMQCAVWKRTKNSPFHKQIIPVLWPVPISNRLPSVCPSLRPMIRSPTDRRLTEMLDQHFVRIGRPDRPDFRRHRPTLPPNRSIDRSRCTKRT